MRPRSRRPCCIENRKIAAPGKAAMKNSTDTRHAVRRTLATVLSALLALGPLGEPAYAALTVLADEPIVAREAAKPNIVYTVDDSGSMASGYIPDYVTAAPTSSSGVSIPAFCRGAIQVNASGAPFYNKDLSSTYNLTTTACSPGSTAVFNFPPFYA